MYIYIYIYIAIRKNEIKKIDCFKMKNRNGQY